MFHMKQKTSLVKGRGTTKGGGGIRSRQWEFAGLPGEFVHLTAESPAGQLLRNYPAAPFDKGACVKCFT